MKSRVQKKETRWEKLDNTANLFPVIANETMTNVYRIAVILSENIEPECLQEALEQVLPWFNTMNVRMRTGMFWYYFETNVKGKPVVREEEDFPCRYIEQHRNKSYLFRVTYYKNRINLEVFHALADGMGAVNFLRELTYQYLRICYPQLSGEMGDRLCDDTSLDTEDSYLKNYKKVGKKTYKSVPAVHMKGERLVRGELGIIHGYMSVRQLKEKAKELGMSINEYLSGIFVYSIYKGYLHWKCFKKADCAVCSGESAAVFWLNDNKEFLCDGECLFFTGKGKIRAAGSDEAGAGRVKEADYTGESGKNDCIQCVKPEELCIAGSPSFPEKASD